MKKPSGGQTPAQRTLEQRQLSELEKLEGQEAQRKLATARRTRGRASLISGSERGIVEGSQFEAKNIATKERLGVEAAEQAAAETEAARLEKIRKGTAFRADKTGYARSLL